MTRNKKLQLILDNFYQKPLVAVSLELILSVLAISFFAFFAIRPTMLTMIDLIQEINDKKNYSNQLEKKIVALATAQTNYQKLADKIALLDQVIPEQSELLLTLKIIEKMVSDQQLVIESLQVAEFNLANLTQSSGEEKITELLSNSNVNFNSNRSLISQPVNLKINLVVNGDFPSIVNLIRNLQNSRRMIVLEQVSFSAQESRNEKKLIANLSLITPYFSKAQSEKNNTNTKVKRIINTQ